MSTATVPYTFANATNADATKVNEDFTAVLAFLNTDVVQKDGAVAMTGALVLSGDPTLDTHAARKAYVDAGDATATAAAAAALSAAVATVEVRLTKSQLLTVANANITGYTETSDVNGFYPGSGTDIIVPSGQAGWYAWSASVVGNTANTGVGYMKAILKRVAPGVHSTLSDSFKGFTASGAEGMLSGVLYLDVGDRLYVTAYCDAADTARTQVINFGMVKL